MAYFDNAATTFPKPEIVYSEMDRFCRANGASAGRGSYEKAATAGQMVSDTRKRIKSLLKCPAKQVVFTPTATIALNIIIQGLMTGKRKTVYISPLEHNAVTRTFDHLRNCPIIGQENWQYPAFLPRFTPKEKIKLIYSKKDINYGQ